MSDVIEIRDVRCDVVVGVLADERLATQPISFDVDFRRSFDRAVTSDDVLHTTNYADVITLTNRIAVEGKFQLLETLARTVAAAILDYDPAITRVTVAVKKIRPPVNEHVASVGVRCTLKR